jgi:serine/threonine-protein kinase
MTSSAEIPPAPARLPRKFGPYLLFEQIGKGGMAEIFLARAKTEFGGHRLCVVKQIIPSFSVHGRFAEMLIHEAKLAARLDHANIVKVYDLGRADAELYIAMEYVEGFDLNELLRRCTKQSVPLPFEFALGVVGGVLRGLDYAHRRTDDLGQPLGIVHRDVSPSNVLISFEGEVKLCDFGIALASQVMVQDRPALDMTEALQGKVGYMSPEHARGEAVDARSDVFAAGVLLWELMSGRRMYRQEAGTSLLDLARAGEVPPPLPRGLANEAEVHAIALRALSRDKEERYPSAAVMLRDLEAYMAKARLVASPLKLGRWLEVSFGTQIVTQRRMLQRAAEALEKGPPVVITPLTLLEIPRRPGLDHAATSGFDHAPAEPRTLRPSADHAAAEPRTRRPPAPDLVASSRREDLLLAWERAWSRRRALGFAVLVAVFALAAGYAFLARAP